MLFCLLNGELPHNQLLRDDIVGSHHSDEVDTRGQVLHIHLAAVVIYAVAQYRSAVVVVYRQLSNHVEGGAYGEDIVCRVREEGDVLVKITQINTVAIGYHKGDMNSTVAAIHRGSWYIDVQGARSLGRKVQTMVVIRCASDSGVGHFNLVCRIYCQEEYVNTVTAIHGLIVLVVNTRGVAVDAVPYEVGIVASAGGIHEQVAAVYGEDKVDDAVTTGGILINALECEGAHIHGQRVKTILLISVSLAGGVVQGDFRAVVDSQYHHSDAVATHCLRIDLGEYTRLRIDGAVPFVAFTSHYLDSVSGWSVDGQVQRHNTVAAVGSSETLLVFATCGVPTVVPLEGAANDGVEG